jgi:hypothetical protein
VIVDRRALSLGVDVERSAFGVFRFRIRSFLLLTFLGSQRLTQPKVAMTKSFGVPTDTNNGVVPSYVGWSF